MSFVELQALYKAQNSLKQSLAVFCLHIYCRIEKATVIKHIPVHCISICYLKK